MFATKTAALNCPKDPIRRELESRISRASKGRRFDCGIRGIWLARAGFTTPDQRLSISSNEASKARVSAGAARIGHTVGSASCTL
jgi:hypothetical protein